MRQTATATGTGRPKLESGGAWVVCPQLDRAIYKALIACARAFDAQSGERTTQRETVQVALILLAQEMQSEAGRARCLRYLQWIRTVAPSDHPDLATAVI